MEGFRLFSCDQEPQLDVAFDKKNCVQQISKYFQVETMTLKHGLFGVVFILEDNENKKVTVKIQRYDDMSLQELRIACLLNKLAPLTRIFTRTRGWTVCSQLPKKWNILIKQQAKNDPQLTPLMYDMQNEKVIKSFVYMNTNRSTLVKKKDSLTLQEVKAIFLVLLHGLWIAKRELGFSHEDLNTGNLMLIRVDGSKADLTLAQTNITIRNMYWFPQIIDFGTSKTNVSPKDMLDLKEIFMGLWKDDFKTLLSDKVYERATNNYKSIPDIWAHFRKWFEQNDEDEDLNISFTSSMEKGICCVCCNGNANLEYTNTVDKYTFCGEKCSSEYDSFKQWLPIY